MRVILHGPLRTDYGESFNMVCRSISDGLEGLSRQLGVPFGTKVHVISNGKKIERAEELEGEADEVHLIPAILGGSGKFFNIIVGTLMIVAGIIMLPNPVGWSLIISGSLMVLQGVVALFMKAPKLNKNEDPEASKYLPINRNTTAINTPITLAWGTIDLAGHWLSLQSDSINLSVGSFPATTS